MRTFSYLEPFLNPLISVGHFTPLSEKPGADQGERVGAFVPGVDVGPVVVSRSLTLSKVPRRIGWRVMITKRISMFSLICSEFLGQ